MAENHYVNKVVFGNDTLVDLTNDSVEASNLLEGETAHDRSGAPITGTAKQGHVIKDADGTSMAQQPTLKFGKYMNVTNDSMNSQTVVDSEPTEIQYSDWLNLTTAQKQAKQWILLNAPDATGGGLLPHLIIHTDTNLTVTVTKGQTTVTATETSTGVYEVDVTSYGTWTISNGTNTVTVNIDTVKEYDITFIPNGSTVTPTDDISIWLACGQRTENYTTLSEVLADSTCLSALMADSNAVDYLVRSKTWAGIELVPTMTSNTTPSGLCFASSVWENGGGTYQIWKAFDKDASGQGWGCLSGRGANEYIGYKFTEGKKVRTFIAIDSNDRMTSVKFQGSNDTTNGSDGTWTDISPALTSKTNRKFTYTDDNPTEYQAYRLYVNSVSQNNIGVDEIYFLSENLCDNSSAMTYIGLDNYASNTLLADSDWNTAIQNSAYFESVDNAKIPTMTSNTAPSGTASLSGSSTGNGFNVWSNGTALQSNASLATAQPYAYIMFHSPTQHSSGKYDIETHMAGEISAVYEFPSARSVNRIDVDIFRSRVGGTVSSANGTFKISLRDATTQAWSEVYTQTDSASSSDKIHEGNLWIGNESNVDAIKVQVTSTASWGLCVGGIQAYGREDV